MASLMKPAPAGRPVDLLLARIAEKSDFPVLAEHLQELMARLAEPEVTLRQIGEVLRKDVGLTLRVLRTANSIDYNRSGRPIVTINHAVAMMGIEPLRDLVMALLLLRHLRHGGPGVRELMVLSLITAHHARLCATRFQLANWEEAYLCGMFRGLGELLAAAYCQEDYRGVLEASRQGASMETAARRVLGCTLDDLGVAAAQRWSLPPRIASVISQGKTRAGLKPKTEGDLLRTLVTFSHELTQAVHRSEPGVRAARTTAVARAFAGALSIKPDVVRQFLRQAMEDATATLEALRIPAEALRLDRQVEAALASLGDDPEDAPDIPDSPVDSLPAPGLASPAEEAAEALSRIESSLVSREWDPGQLLASILDAIRRAGPFDRAVFALLTPDRAAVQGRLVSPDSASELLKGFRFAAPAGAGPLSRALTGRADVYACDGPYLDSEVRRATGAACFGIYPIIVDNIVAGCLYFDRETIPVPLTQAAAAQAAHARDLAARAIARIRRRG